MLPPPAGLDSLHWSDPITLLFQTFLDYKATTRGGRRMDAILRGQAQFRQGALNVGAKVVRAGNAPQPAREGRRVREVPALNNSHL